MPVKLKIDWNLAYDLFTRGLTYREIANQVGCKEVSLRAHGTRNNWREKVALARQAVSAIVQNMSQRQPETVQRRAEKWVDATISDMERTVVALGDLPVPKNLDGLRKHEEVWGMHVKRGRSTFGLDSQGQSITLNVGLMGESDLIPSTEVIDVQPEPDGHTPGATPT